MYAFLKIVTNIDNIFYHIALQIAIVLSFFSKIVDKINKLKYNGETQRQQYIAPKKDRL